MKRALKRILITPGEPAGIGPDITIEAASKPWEAEIIAIADPDVLNERARALGKTITIIESKLGETRYAHKPYTLQVFPVKCATEVSAGKLNSANSAYVIKTLEIAANLSLKKKADAIVTGPVHKGVINEANIAFTGHTEFFANCCDGVKTVMLFVVNELKIALATTHLPLAKVPAAITTEQLASVISVLNDGLKKYFSIPHPTIYVCGLNPHAGEGGYLGREEIETIEPLINKMRIEGHSVFGPLPADTLFTQKYLQKADAYLAMYHDQALPLVKYIGFGSAVNVTLGLPFLRTSVDHGTALDVAGSGKADPSSMMTAVELAIRLLS